MRWCFGWYFNILYVLFCSDMFLYNTIIVVLWKETRVLFPLQKSFVYCTFDRSTSYICGRARATWQNCILTSVVSWSSFVSTTIVEITHLLSISAIIIYSFIFSYRFTYVTNLSKPYMADAIVIRRLQKFKFVFKTVLNLKFFFCNHS